MGRLAEARSELETGAALAVVELQRRHSSSVPPGAQ